MRYTKWQWWLAAGLVLVPVLLLAAGFAAPLAAQSPAPSLQATGAVCPLSDEQVQKATTAFDEIAQTLTKQPRCVNCHGGVNPFAADGDGHGGDHIDQIFRPVSGFELGLIILGIRNATDTVDEDATNQKCQECHSGLPGWKLAPAADVFKDQTAVHICKNQKDVFGTKRANTGPPGFARHIQFDVRGVKFIDDAFKGDRGLNDVGQALATGPLLDRPNGVTHAHLDMLAFQWADALGSKFKGDEECGCVPPHHYAFQIVRNSDVEVVPVAQHAAGTVQTPLVFKDGDRFTAAGNEQLVITLTLQSPPLVCPPTPVIQTVSWSLHGSIVGADQDNPGIMHIDDLSTSAPAVKKDIPCTALGVPFPFHYTIPAISPNMVTVPDIEAVLGKTTEKSVSIPGMSSSVTLTIIQVD